MQTAHKMLPKYCVKMEQQMKHITQKYTSIIPLDLYDDNGEIDRRASPGWRRDHEYWKLSSHYYSNIRSIVITLLFKHHEYWKLTSHYYHDVMVLFDQILKYNTRKATTQTQETWTHKRTLGRKAIPK
eukprot:206585_1